MSNGIMSEISGERNPPINADIVGHILARHLEISSILLRRVIRICVSVVEEHLKINLNHVSHGRAVILLAGDS